MGVIGGKYGRRKVRVDFISLVGVLTYLTEGNTWVGSGCIYLGFWELFVGLGVEMDWTMQFGPKLVEISAFE